MNKRNFDYQGVPAENVKRWRLNSVPCPHCGATVLLRVNKLKACPACGKLLLLAKGR